MKRLIVMLAAALTCAAASAQTWPAKPVRFVVPYPAGGPLDVSARLLGQKLQESLGQPFLVENKPGAGGNIGADFVAKGPADGSAILMGAVATHAINPSLYPQFPYDPVRDFKPVTLVVQVPNVLIVNNDVPARNVAELIALAKAKPGRLDFASGSTGSTGHLAGELFKTMTGTFMVHIPYKGAPPAVADLLGGRVHLMFDNLASALPNIRAGKVRALAVTTKRRSSFLPDLPTLDESGLKGFDLTTWWGVMVPARTPQPIVERLNTELLKAMDAPDVKDKLRAMGSDAPAIRSPEGFAGLIESELALYAKLVKASGAKAD